MFPRVYVFIIELDWVHACLQDIISNWTLNFNYQFDVSNVDEEPSQHNPINLFMFSCWAQIIV